MDGLRMGSNCRGKTIQRAIKNVKTNIVDFTDENAYVHDDDHDFTSEGNRD